MKLKKVLFIILSILIILGLALGLYIYLKNRQAKKVVQSKPSTEKSEPIQVVTAKRAGSYLAYDPALFAQASDGKVVLFFNAKWSSTCKQLDQTLKANAAKLPNNFTILNVDYDKNYALRKKYGVPFEDTFVQVDSAGTMVNRWSGSEDMPEIVALAK